MNNNTPHNQDEKLVKQFLQKQAYEAKDNPWFTHRTMHRLPAAQKNTGRNIITAVTIAAVVACGILLYNLNDYILPPEENKITDSLLCIYTAIMGTIVLVVQQVIRLIKTYF